MPQNTIEQSTNSLAQKPLNSYLEDALAAMEAVVHNDFLKVEEILSNPLHLKYILLYQDDVGSSLFMQAAQLEDIAIFKLLLHKLIDIEDSACLIKAYTAKDCSEQGYMDYWKYSCLQSDKELDFLLAGVRAIYERALNRLPSQNLKFSCANDSSEKIAATDIDEYAELKTLFSKNINLPNDRGNPPLIQMILNFNLTMVEWLLSQEGIDLRVKNLKGMNAIMIATERGLVRYLKPLLVTLQKLPCQEIADIYNDSETISPQGVSYSVKDFFYKKNEDTPKNYQSIKTLLTTLDEIAQDPKFKPSEDIKRNQVLASTYCEHDADHSKQYRKKIYKKLKELNTLFLPPNWSSATPLTFSAITPSSLGPSKLRFSGEVDTQTPIEKREEVVVNPQQEPAENAMGCCENLYTLGKEEICTTDGPRQSRSSKKG